VDKKPHSLSHTQKVERRTDSKRHCQVDQERPGAQIQIDSQEDHWQESLDIHKIIWFSNVRTSYCAGFHEPDWDVVLERDHISLLPVNFLFVSSCRWSALSWGRVGSSLLCWWFPWFDSVLSESVDLDVAVGDNQHVAVVKHPVDPPKTNQSILNHFSSSIYSTFKSFTWMEKRGADCWLEQQISDQRSCPDCRGTAPPPPYTPWISDNCPHWRCSWGGWERRNLNMLKILPVSSNAKYNQSSTYADGQDFLF